MTAVLFVCLGNICRSPAAEAMLRHLALQRQLSLSIQSCGIGGWHVGEAPDERMQQAARARDIVMNSRAQQFHVKFFEEFDYILAADQEVLQDLQRQAREPHHQNKLHLMTAFSQHHCGKEVLDPYYSDAAAFEQVLSMLEDACEGLLQEISTVKADSKFAINKI